MLSPPPQWGSPFALLPQSCAPSGPSGSPKPTTTSTPSPTSWTRYDAACSVHGELGAVRVGLGGCRNGDRLGTGSRLTQSSPPLQKERDLELAARIGQSLLKQNRSLTERNELLEEQLELAKEEVPAPGHSPWARSAALAPLRPRPCPDVPSPPPRSRSCATRSPCGTICSTSTPPPRRRASPPRPPPRREWVPAPLPTPWGFFGVGGWRNWVWGPADGVGG